MGENGPVRIVILGGGFAGISAAMELGRRTRRNRGIEVHLVSEENYFVFQPMLPEVVACRIEPTHILNPIRQLCKHVQFHCATVESIDTESREIRIVGRDKRRVQTLGYDHLVVALGLTMDLSRIPGMAEHSLPIKTLGDAFHLRNHVLSMLEEADIEPDECLRRQALTVVTVGGGFSGVETVAEINDMIKAVLRYYPKARATGARIVLIHSRDRILNELGEGLARFAEQKLRDRGVELILESRVKEASPTGIVLNDGRTIQAGTVICTVGNGPHPLIAKTGFPQERGRILADEHLRVGGVEGIWALGDAAMIPDVRRGGYCPPTAQYAMRQGKQCARNVLAAIAGKPTQPFAFGGLGQLAVVGHRCGVAHILGVNVAGLLAWWLWRSVYFMKLPGLRSKIRVGIDWALDMVFPRDITKLDVERTRRVPRAHFREGDMIIRRGEIGDRFYIMETGEAEVLQPDAAGEDRRVATLTAGDSFGEIALLNDTLRTASVRCLTPVDVISFARSDFQALVGSYDILRTKVSDDLARRTARDPDA